FILSPEAPHPDPLPGVPGRGGNARSRNSVERSAGGREGEPPGEPRHPPRYNAVGGHLNMLTSRPTTMSDNWIALIPEDPRFVPERARQTRARDRLSEIAPGADEITIKASNKIRFFDCGGNFEQVLCPACR